MGSVDVRYDNKNPAELYVGTTWELLASDKYIRTGNIALSTGGNNIVTIAKANLPNIKLKIDSFSLSLKDSRLSNIIYKGGYNLKGGDIPRAGSRTVFSGANTSPVGSIQFTNIEEIISSSSALPYTENLGSGTSLNIQPEYTTLKFWKRLT